MRGGPPVRGQGPWSQRPYSHGRCRESLCLGVLIIRGRGIRPMLWAVESCDACSEPALRRGGAAGLHDALVALGRRWRLRGHRLPRGLFDHVRRLFALFRARPRQGSEAVVLIPSTPRAGRPFQTGQLVHPINYSRWGVSPQENLLNERPTIQSVIEPFAMGGPPWVTFRVAQSFTGLGRETMVFLCRAEWVVDPLMGSRVKRDEGLPHGLRGLAWTNSYWVNGFHPPL